MTALLAVVAAVLLCAVCVQVVRSRADDRRGPLEVRDDWWPEFERQFRAHVARIERRRRRRASGRVRSLLMIAAAPLAVGRAVTGSLSRVAVFSARVARASFTRPWWRRRATAGDRRGPLGRRRAG